MLCAFLLLLLFGCCWFCGFQWVGLSIGCLSHVWRFVDIFDGIKADAGSHSGISQLSLVDLTTSTTMKVKTKESNFCVRSPQQSNILKSSHRASESFRQMHKLHGRIFSDN